MMVDGIIDCVRARIQPKTDHAIDTASAYCQAHEYSGACRAPKSTAVSSTPAATPNVRESNGWMKPRKSSSSNSGAIVTAITLNMASESGVFVISSIGDFTWGV